MLVEVQFITGYNRKYALRILNTPQAQRSLLAVKGKTVKLKPRKKDPPAGRSKIYTDQVIDSWPRLHHHPGHQGETHVH
jgi:hypothetical protein